MTLCSLTKYKWQPSTDQNYTFLPKSAFYRIMRGFHRTFATGVASRQGTLTPPDTWYRSIWDLHIFYLLRSILFVNLSLFFRTMLFEHPSVLSRFCFTQVHLQVAWPYVMRLYTLRSCSCQLRIREYSIRGHRIFNEFINIHSNHWNRMVNFNCWGSDILQESSDSSLVFIKFRPLVTPTIVRWHHVCRDFKLWTWKF